MECCSLALDSKAVVRTVVDILAVLGRGAQRNGYPASGLEGLESEVVSRDAQEVRAVQNCPRDGGVLGPKRIVARKRDYSSGYLSKVKCTKENRHTIRKTVCRCN
jgi:hypothetical protein